MLVFMTDPIIEDPFLHMLSLLQISFVVFMALCHFVLALEEKRKPTYCCSHVTFKRIS